jgi:hypothetical protein
MSPERRGEGGQDWERLEEIMAIMYANKNEKNL